MWPNMVSTQDKPTGSATAINPGEQFARQHCGIGELGNRISRSVRGDIPEVAELFLRGQKLLYACVRDVNHRPWVAALLIEPGSIEISNHRILRLRAVRMVGEPGHGAFRRPTEIGLLAIEPATRRRMRINGVAALEGTDLVVHANQVFSNCKRFIQPRHHPKTAGSAPGDMVTSTDSLAGPAGELIARSDTLFIGSQADPYGADCSHRGGEPGFVRVLDEHRLSWDELPGNAMFATLGNLVLNPATALLFVDFALGDVVQVAGDATISWPVDLSASGQRPRVELTVRAVVTRCAALPHPWVESQTTSEKESYDDG